MRALLIATVLFMVGCAGSTKWATPENDAGIPILPELTLLPGSSGQVPLTLEARGSHSGTYDITATSNAPEIATATVEPSSASVDDNNPLVAVVTVTASADAEPGRTATISVRAERRGDDIGATTSVRVEIAE